MAVYLLYMASPVLICLLLELLSGQSVNGNQKIKTKYLVLAGLVLFLMVGLRNPGNGSGDTQFYCDFWRSTAKVPLSGLIQYLKNTDLEYGFQLCVWLLAKLFKNQQWILIFSGAFFAVSVCRFAQKNCKDVVLALTVFNCLGLFNFMVQGMRQAVAMCICLWAIEQCKKNRFIPFFLLVVLAATFHASAVVFALVYLLGKLSLNLKGYLLVAAGVIASALLLSRLFQIVNFFIDDHYEIGKGADSGGLVAIAIHLAVLVFGLLFRDKEDPHYALFVYMVFVSAVMLIMRNTVSSIVERMSYYFAFGEMAVISNSVSALKSKDTKILTGVLITLLCIGVAVYKASYSILIPYRFFWQ